MFPRTLAAILAVVALCTGAACYSSPSSLDLDDAHRLDDFVDDVIAGGKADGEMEITPVEIGDSLDGLVLEVLPPGTRPTSRHLQLFRLHLQPKQSVVIAMQATSSSLNPYFVLMDNVRGSWVSVSEADTQALLPMGAERDAVAGYTAGGEADLLVLAAGGNEMDTGGTYRIDFVALPEDPGVDLGTTNPHVLEVTDELRLHDPIVRTFVNGELLSERDDGLLEEGDELASMPEIDQREIRWRLDEVNGLRSDLFDGFGALAGAGASRSAIQGACAAAWAAVR
ncbi:MAG: hypothetical protein JRI23_10310 [Deltaproteobacteria bacterium]|jgi:hypothetical protein|nr:hypothetical protein [Deltaproteobacteria bacterium]MBW2532061.1 hypothetical protein [Deltaproteobacteria bacterium]